MAISEPGTGAAVEITVAWELCWYQFLVDLEGDAQSVSLTAQGSELAELDGVLSAPNAVADERGQLTFAASAE